MTTDDSVWESGDVAAALEHYLGLGRRIRDAPLAWLVAQPAHPSLLRLRR